MGTISGPLVARPATSEPLLVMGTISRPLLARHSISRKLWSWVLLALARQDNVEKPRYDEQFNTSSASLLCSPETVSCGLSDGSPGSVMTPPVPISPVHQGLVNASLHSPTCDMDYVTSQTSVTSTPVSEGTSDLEEVPPGGDNHEKHVKNSMTSSEIKTTLANIQRDFDSKFEHLFKQYGVK